MRDKRFSAVPVVTAILKTIAVLLVLFALYALIQGLRETVASWRGGAGQFGQIPPTLGFGPKLQSLLQPLFSFIQSLFLASLAWGFGELFNMVRLILLGKTPEVTPASASED